MKLQLYDTNWSFTEFTGDSNSTSSPLVIEIDSDKTIGALFEENQTVILIPEINVTVVQTQLICFQFLN